MRTIFSGLLAGLLATTSGVATFLGPVVGSIKGILTPAELLKAVSAALGASTIAGFGVAFFTTIATDAQAAPAGIGTAIVVFASVHLEELLRRLDHGTPPGVTKLSAEEMTMIDHREPFGLTRSS